MRIAISLCSVINRREREEGGVFDSDANRMYRAMLMRRSWAMTHVPRDAQGSWKLSAGRP